MHTHTHMHEHASVERGSGGERDFERWLEPGSALKVKSTIIGSELTDYVRKY